MRAKSSLSFAEVPLSEIHEYSANAREHSESQLAMLEASIREHGFAFPVVLDQAGVLVAGHARLAAARRLGLERVPAVRLANTSETALRALRLADNRIAELGTWNEELLERELEQLRALDVELASVGFDEAALAALFDDDDAGENCGDVDAQVATDERAPLSAHGDVWNLGAHRLVCGDSTVAGYVDLALAGERPEIMVTDPPYGVDYEPKWRNESDIGRRAFGVAREHVVLNDNRANWREAWSLFPGDVAYVWHAALFADQVAEDLRAEGFEIRAQIVWVKQMAMLSRGHYHWQHEPCWYAVRKGATANWLGDRKQSTVWHVDALVGYTVGSELDARQAHGTQKPAELYLRAIANHTEPGGLVYDPFAGSGTALVACEKLRRRCIAIDYDPRCVDVALRRWRTLTGKEPTRSGVALADLEAAR